MLRIDARVITSDSDEFMEAIEPLLPTAYRLAYALVHRREEIDDILQEATVKACGVAVDRPAGEKLGSDPVDRSVVNVGTVSGLPTCRPSRSVAARHVVCRWARSGAEGP